MGGGGGGGGSGGSGGLLFLVFFLVFTKSFVLEIKLCVFKKIGLPSLIFPYTIDPTETSQVAII